MPQKIYGTVLKGETTKGKGVQALANDCRAEADTDDVDHNAGVDLETYENYTSPPTVPIPTSVYKSAVAASGVIITEGSGRW